MYVGFSQANFRHLMLHVQSVDFEIPAVFVGRIVGSHGTAVNKIRDALGVKIDFSQEAEDKEKESSKKKKTAQTVKAKVKVRVLYSFCNSGTTNNRL